MFLNTRVLWALIGAIAVSEVSALRFTSPKHLFSEEPNIMDDLIHISKLEHGRFARSANDEPYRPRTRRASTSARRPPNPTITKSASFCNHDALLMRWSFDNVLTQTGTIIALCVSMSSRSSQSSVVFASYDYGLTWQNISKKFQPSGEKISINNYYFVKERPNSMIFTDKANKRVFLTNDGAKTITSRTVKFSPDRISINPQNANLVLISDDTSTRDSGKAQTQVHISKDGGQTFKKLNEFIDVKAAWWSEPALTSDKATDLFIEAKAKGGGGVQGYKLDCRPTTVNCSNLGSLTSGAPLNGDIVDFLVKGPYMFVTQHNADKSAINLFVQYKRKGAFKKAKILTSSPLKEAFVYDVSGGHVMLVVNHRKNETNLYNSLDASGLNYSLSLPRVLYHNPHTEVSSLWLRNAVRYRFVDIWKVQALPSVYFATQLTQGPVGGRYLISMMTFDKGGLWKKVQGPPKNKYDRPCTYPACSLHVNLMYGSIYRYSKTTPLLSRKSAPGLIMVTGVLGTNLKITPETYLSRDGGNTFKMVLRGKRRYNFGDHGGVILTSDFSSSRYLQFSVDYENFYYVRLPTTPTSVEIKKIVTEPGEKGAVFLVIAYDRVADQFFVYQVNATNSLGVPCTKDDFYNMTVADIGVGGCAVKTVEIRNASRRCLTGKEYSREVKSISYKNCMCRRRHYACDIGFQPDERGSCILMDNTKVNLVPKNCPEGSSYMKSRGYIKLDDYKTCTEDNVTLSTLSYVKSPCPVEKLELASVKTVPEMKNRMVKIAHGETLKVDVTLKNGFLPNVNFKHVLDEYNVSGTGEKYKSHSIKMDKPGSFVLHITVSNAKSVFYYSVNVNVIRKLNSSMATIMTYPDEPGIDENVVVMLQMAKYLNPREYGFPLDYYKWKVESFDPQKTLVDRTTSLPSITVSFNTSGSIKISATISNGADVSTITVTKDIMVTVDLKPKNVRLSYQEPNLVVEWDVVQVPRML
ncbi:sortilin-related receptor-like [Dendronephthya gigantea]|uniref:sortilin-related receptor-like n=1 Tax=Dendronephthya gigantea TaxID=151771 RepID=UPI00106D2575|nr:sortilin-related receptor-like [Dendronephthya gigantea]XP_028396514.1 sortilin-related receptor-like [Dendronephthya gigantea]